MRPPPAKRPGNPYPGPRPFESGDEPRFFGRDREVGEILSLLYGHQLVLLYAQSGSGKTSLLQAALIPAMRRERWDVLPVARVRGLVPEGVDLDRVRNVYTLNCLLSWCAGERSVDELASMSISDFLEARARRVGEDADDTARVLVFDQFEELFASHEEFWTHRDAFLRELAEAMGADQGLRVLIALREDYLAQLEPRADLLPGRLRTRYRLERLSLDAAQAAIEGPLEGTGVSFVPAVAEALARRLMTVRVRTPSGGPHEVPGQFLEPLQLQIVCRRLWDSLRGDVQEITEQHLEALADVDRALMTFYEEGLRVAVDGADVDEEQLRTWFDVRLVTPAETRGTVFRGDDDTEGIPNTAIDLLEKHGIIRAEYRASATWYELPHDRFVEPIRTSNRAWKVLRRTNIGLGTTRLPSLAESEAEVWEVVGRRVASLRSALAGVVVLALVLAVLVGWALIERGMRHRAEASARAISLTSAADERAERDLGAAALLGLEALRLAGDDAATLTRARNLVAEAMGAIAGSIVVAAPQDSVTALALSPDGTRLLLASRSGRAVLVGTRSGAVLDTLDGTLEAAAAVAFDGGGVRIATAEAQGIRVWDETTGVELLHIQTDVPAASVAFDPDARLIAGGDVYGNVSVWNAANGSVVWSASVHYGAVEALSFSEHGRYLVSGGANGHVIVWNAADGTHVADTYHRSAIRSVAVSQVSGIGLSADATETMAWRVPADGDPPDVLALVEPGRSLGVLPGSEPGGILVARDTADAVVLKDLEGGTCLTLPGGDRPVRVIAFSRDLRVAATLSSSGVVRVWSPARPLRAESWEHPVDRLDVSAARGLVALAGGSTDLELRDLATGELRNRFGGHADWIRDVAFAPGGATIATASDDGTVRIWDVDRGVELHVLEGHTDWVRAVAYRSDGAQLASTGDDGSVRVWDAATGAPVWSRPPAAEEYDWGSALAFSPGGEMLAAGTTYGRVQLADSTGAVLGELDNGWGEQIWALSFNSAGDLLAAAQGDSGVVVWDVPTRRSIGRVHGGPAYAVAFTPDGGRVVVPGEGGAVHVADARSGAELAALPGPRGTVDDLVVTEDGTSVLALEQGVMWRQDLAGVGAPLLSASWLLALRAPDPPDCAWGDDEDCADALPFVHGLTAARALALSGEADSAVLRLREALRSLPARAASPLPGHEDPPDALGRVLAARGLLDQALARARAGRLADALDARGRALQLDPGAEAPDSAALHVLASRLDSVRLGVTERLLAEVGRLRAGPPAERARARVLLARATGLDPGADASAHTLVLDLLDSADSAAVGGRIAEAIDRYRRAAALDERAADVAVQVLLDSGGTLVVQGEIDAARAAFHAVAELGRPEAVEPLYWNQLCWWGSLWSRAADVRDACERAVGSTAPDDAYYSSFTDSRGVARALLGDLQGAAEDFQFFVRDPEQSPSLKSKREQWIKSLLGGVNPFTSEVLESLKSEGA